MVPLSSFFLNQRGPVRFFYCSTKGFNAYSDEGLTNVSVCSKVRRKEGSGQGWLVKTQVFLFKADKLTQVRTLRHPETSTLSFFSAITLCIRSDCFSLTARAPESSLRLSL